MAIDLKWHEDFEDDLRGDIEFVEGREAFLQSIKLWFETPKGSLFYDPNYGTEIFLFIQVAGSVLNQMALVQTIKRELQQNPEIDIQSIKIDVLYWENDRWRAQAIFNRVGSDRPLKMNINNTQNDLGVEIL